MARRNRPVLYEVVRRGERQRETSWFTRLINSLTSSGTQRPQARSESQPPQTTTPETEPEPQRSANSPTQTTESAPAPKSPETQPSQTPLLDPPASTPSRPVSLIDSLQNADWSITLNRSALLACGLVGVVLLIVSFELGRMSASPDTSEDTLIRGSAAATDEPAGRASTRTEMASSSNRRENPGVALPNRPTTRETESQPLQPTSNFGAEPPPRGRYLVVQDLSVQRKRDQRIPDGQRIVAHLSGKGIQAKVVQSGRKAPLVIVSTPLDDMSKAAIENLKSRIRRAGSDFSDYNFKGCYETTF
jgi:hypothetical protein